MNLDNSFIDFVTSLFPSISPFIQAQTKFSLDQFYEKGKTFECYNTKSFDDLCQGDVIENVPIIKVAENGTLEKSLRTVIVLSNSCDIENDDYILVAPFYSFTEAALSESQINEMKQNRFYGKMYFPDVSEEEMFADFSFIQAIPKVFIHKSISEKKSKVLHSLNLVGYYLFLCKLTIHLMRPEDSGVQKSRERIDYQIV